MTPLPVTYQLFYENAELLCSPKRSKKVYLGEIIPNSLDMRHPSRFPMITKKINHLLGPQLINIPKLEMSFYQRVGTFRYSRELKSKLYKKKKITTKKEAVIFM